MKLRAFYILGRAKRSLEENRDRTYNVSKIIIHVKYLELMANYNATNQEYFNWDYDIALLKLNSPATNDVTLIELPSGSLNVSNEPSLHCTAAGMFNSLNYI